MAITSIGYGGLGQMVSALARRLLLDHEILVHDRDPAAAQRLGNQRATSCPTTGDLAATRAMAAELAPLGLELISETGIGLADEIARQDKVERVHAAQRREHALIVNCPVTG